MEGQDLMMTENSVLARKTETFSFNQEREIEGVDIFREKTKMGFDVTRERGNGTYTGFNW